MRLLWITTILVVANLVKSGPAIGNKDPPSAVLGSLPIIDKIKLAVDGTSTDVCLDDAPMGDDFSLSVLEDGQPVIEYEESTSVTGKCITFDVNMKGLATKNLRFIVHSEDGGGGHTQLATGNIDGFPSIITGITWSLGQDPDTNQKYVLRAEGNDAKDLTIDDPSLHELASTDNIKYWTGLSDSHYTVKICETTSPDDIEVCNSEEETQDASSTAAVSVATLEILEPATSAKINLEIESGAQEDNYDITIEHKDLSTLQNKMYSPVPGNALTCETQRIDTEHDVFTIRIFKIENKLITEARKATIHDRDLFLSQLGTENIIEGAWYHGHEETANKNYVFSHVEDAKATEIDCTHLDKTHCYGYIMDVTIATQDQTLKLQPKVGDDPSKTDENQKTFNPKPPPHQDLVVHNPRLSWEQNSKIIHPKICFKHTSLGENVEFSHYELIFINNKGQWLKHKTLSQNTSELCFTSFSVNTDDFDVTDIAKAVVIQRGVDGITVLASGVTDLF